MRFNRFMIYIFAALVLVGMASCSSEDSGWQEDEVEKTIVMFYPWSTTLLGEFKANVSDFSSVIASRGLHGERVVVCMATAPDDAVVYELKSAKGRCVADTLRRYHNRTFTSRQSMASLFADLKEIAPARKYAMIVGCHGMAWVHTDEIGQPQRIMRHYDVVSPLHTRYIGGLSADCQIETQDFASALKDAGLKMEYILFDNCYMSSVEVAYEMKDVAEYIIASPTEIMSSGFPYRRCGEYLLGNADCVKVAEEFIAFYSQSKTPYATIAVTDCSEMDNLAAIVRRINQASADVSVAASDLQRMDGYTPTLFYDFGHYISKKCSDPELLDAFSRQLDKTIIYKGNTEYYYSALAGPVRIDHFSGMNTSAPSTNRLAQGYEETEWGKRVLK